MQPPYVFESARLRYRPFHVDDAAGFFELNSDPEVIRDTGDPPFETVEAARDFLQAYNHYDEVGYGRWSVDLKLTGEFIGWAGLKYTPALDEVDAGCRFFQRCWGKGFGTEATLACLQFGFDQLGIERIVGRAMAGNAGSVRMMEKAGMQLVGPRDFDGHPGVIYAIAASK